MTIMATQARMSPARFSMSVKTACQAGNVTKGDLAAALGMSPESMSRKLAAKIRWNLDEVYAVADIFGVDPGAMVNGSGEWLNTIDPDAVRGRLRDLLNHTLPL
ncbi:helix-turn-helix domain-containing protein (plasmid) [Streptomyces sp. BI20]|uniref:helix-turn-helix domain-containing protein n=1 Tax=Streptomyces sp. BI20 TaxID=3403460 RepID=UPI003C776DC0